MSATSAAWKRVQVALSVGDTGTHKPAAASTDDIVNLEQVDHADQASIDAAFDDLMANLDI